MKSLAVVALALSLAAPSARAQQSGTSSGSSGRSASRKNKKSAGARIGDTGTRRRAADRSQANVEENVPARPPASLAQPTREEILEAQRRGRIRDRDVPDWIRGQQLTELEVPNSVQLQEVLKNPYRHRQDDLKP